MNIIVTGASRGIGFECVKILSSKKENKIIAISRDASKLKELSKTCESLHGYKNVFDIPFDLSEISKRHKELSLLIRNRYTNFDVLINNAGFLLNKPFHEYDPDEINKIVNVNFLAPAKLAQLFIDELTGGHVVNISSMGGVQGSSKYPGLSYYSASKAALATLTECLAAEYAHKNIAFNCLALGAVQTEMLHQAFPDYKAPVTADQMAAYIAWFAVEGKKYFNGKIIPVALSNP